MLLTGRPSLFRGKAPASTVKGRLTPDGVLAFEKARVRLRVLYRRVVGTPPGSVSDADVIEYLARGDAATEHYLATHRRT